MSNGIETLKEVLKAIKNETRVIEGHPDPGALAFCWYEVWEMIENIEKNYINTTPHDPLADEDDPRTYGLNNGI